MNSRPCFNGAATFQSRRLPTQDMGSGIRCASMEPRPFSRGDYQPFLHLSRTVLASMEPRPFSRGDRRAEVRVADASAPLQWSRDHSVAETSHPGVVRNRPFRRFNGAATIQSRRRCQQGHGLRFNGAAKMSVAETARRTATSFRITWLQWSRDHSVAETPQVVVVQCSRGHQTRFNGAATFQSRRLP